ncbi:hypothetical protein [Zhongshania sp.]|jgi:fido (protein-threonine AMPylation protein)|uniref:hypothetical protein n=1 Tax=Zhongshania sp. TaxID=1971902 RepID=UPI0039E4A6EC
MAELEINPLSSTYNLTYLKAIHYYLFNDVYQWAGFAIQWSAISGEAMANACRKGRTTTPDYRDLIKLNTIEPDSMPD